MTVDDQTFFQKLGARIAELRRAQGLTQAELGELLDVSQQTVNSFEKGRRRVPASALAPIAQALGIGIEELLGESQPDGKRGPAPRLRQQLDRVSRLPRAKQKFVAEMLETGLQQAGR